MAEPPATAPTTERLICLDFVRGIAVLGILLMNIVGYAWPEAAVLSPRAPVGPRGTADETLFLIEFVLVDGKFRGLFSLLFGASLLLLVQRADAAGKDGIAFQQRRLAWLALFGLAHFFLLWWGDILFLYAACGFLVLAAIDWPVRKLVTVALLLYAVGAVWLGASMLVDAAPWLGGSEEARKAATAAADRRFAAEGRAESQVYLGAWWDGVAHRLSRDWHRPLSVLMTSALETVPLMLLGMALLRAGLLAGRWPSRRVLRWALGCLVVGLVATVPVAWWIAVVGYPLPLILLASFALAAPGRLALTVGYAALLVLLASRAGATRAGERVIAAGRMAFSNYLGTSVVMAGVFHGWGLGLYGRLDRLELLGFVVLGWAVMLVWSKPWLARFRQGPLEWLWRSLVRRRLQPFRRLAIASNSH